jgi:high-affinity iron transporter
MLGAAIIVFRESLEAALFVGILAAAARGMTGRGRWLGAGVAAGVVGAFALAAGAQQIAAWADGVGADLVNAAILALALAMLAWHCVWISNQGAGAAAEARELGGAFSKGDRAPWTLTLVAALAVLREGAETVLFVTGYAAGNGHQGTLLGALLGLVAGASLGTLLYLGLSRTPIHRLFAVTNTMILLLAAAIASQLARSLTQAGVIESWTSPLWDSTALLDTQSALGTLLHALVGYDARPSGAQLAFYLVTLIAIVIGSRRVRAMRPAVARR